MPEKDRANASITYSSEGLGSEFTSGIAPRCERAQDVVGSGPESAVRGVFIPVAGRCGGSRGARMPVSDAFAAAHRESPALLGRAR